MSILLFRYGHPSLLIVLTLLFIYLFLFIYYYARWQPDIQLYKHDTAIQKFKKKHKTTHKLLIIKNYLKLLNSRFSFHRLLTTVSFWLDSRLTVALTKLLHSVGPAFFIYVISIDQAISGMAGSYEYITRHAWCNLQLKLCDPCLSAFEALCVKMRYTN